jgi:hypothetical protein
VIKAAIKKVYKWATEPKVSYLGMLFIYIAANLLYSHQILPRVLMLIAHYLADFSLYLVRLRYGV